jgi:hypothetical protein
MTRVKNRVPIVSVKGLKPKVRGEHKTFFSLGMETHTNNPSTSKAETGVFCVYGQTGLIARPCLKNGCMDKENVICMQIELYSVKKKNEIMLFAGK